MKPTLAGGISLLLATRFAGVAADPLTTSASICQTLASFLYTSGSSTYVLSTYIPTPTLSTCPQAWTVSETVYATVTQWHSTSIATSYRAPSTACPTASLPNLLVGSGFDQGDGVNWLYNRSASSDAVSGEVVSGPPLAPFAGSSYYLITFAPTSGKMIRQAQAVDAYNLSQATQSYSLFQPFNVSHGSSYVLSIEAKAVGLSSSDATCSLALCANHECSSPATLTSNYMRYSFTFTMFIIANSIDVMYSVSCSGAAYVALDDAGAYNIGFARAVAASTIYATQYILDNVTLTASGSVLTSTAPGQVVNRTIFSSLPAATRTTTVLLSASEVVETAYSYVTASLTLLASTLTTTLVEEVTATSQLPQTTLIETSIEAPSTYFETTTLPGVTETRTNTPARDTLVLNVTQYPAAAVVTDTTTILSEYTRSIPPGTLTATETLSPGTTTQNVTQYAAASTLTVPTTVVSEYTTSLPGYTTEIDFTFLLTTTLVAQTTTVVSEYTTTLPGYTSTEVETTTLPAATLTVTEETTAMVASSTSAMTATTTLPTSTIASTTSSVAPTPLVTLTINNNGCGTIYIGQQQDFSEMPDPETVSFVGGPYSGDTIQVAAAPNVMLQFTVDQSLEPVWQSYDHFNEIQTGNPAQYNVPNNVPSEILSVTCYPGAQYTIVNYCVSSVVSSQITVRDATLNYYLGQVNAYMESYAQGVFAIQPGNTLELSANVYGSFTPTYVHYQDPNNDYDCVGDSCSLTAVSAGNTIQFLCQ